MIASNQNITLIAGLAITIFAAVLLFTRPPAERRPGLELLGLLMLLVLVYPLLHPIFRALGWRMLSSFIGIPLLSAPIFYLYIRRLTEAKEALPWWIYALFGLVLLLALLPALQSPGPPGPPGLREDLGPGGRHSGGGAGFRPFIGLSVMLAFSLLIFLRLRKHRQEVQEIHSELSEWKLLGSAYIVLGVFLVTNLFLFFHRLTWRSVDLPPAFNREIHGSAFLFMIFAFSVFLVRQGPIFEPNSDPGIPGRSDRDPDDQSKKGPLSDSKVILSSIHPGDAKNPADSADPVDSGFTEPERPISELSEPAKSFPPRLQEVVSAGEHPRQGETEPEPDAEEVERLRSAIEAGRLYLDSDLTLDQLARILGQSRHRVSYILNRGVNQNFYRYVNGLRVEHAARLLRDPAYANWPVLRLALESGFSSKATFNRLFKEYKGRTPMEWRERAG